MPGCIPKVSTEHQEGADPGRPKTSLQVRPECEEAAAGANPKLLQEWLGFVTFVRILGQNLLIKRIKHLGINAASTNLAAARFFHQTLQVSQPNPATPRTSAVNWKPSLVNKATHLCPEKNPERSRATSPAPARMRSGEPTDKGEEMALLACGSCRRPMFTTTRSSTTRVVALFKKKKKKKKKSRAEGRPRGQRKGLASCFGGCPWEAVHPSNPRRGVGTEPWEGKA